LGFTLLQTLLIKLGCINFFFILSHICKSPGPVSACPSPLFIVMCPKHCHFSLGCDITSSTCSISCEASFSGCLMHSLCYDSSKPHAVNVYLKTCVHRKLLSYYPQGQCLLTSKPQFCENSGCFSSISERLQGNFNQIAQKHKQIFSFLRELLLSPWHLVI
jgi:hypothetical protein